jgi:hypothetical protein
VEHNHQLDPVFARLPQLQRVRGVVSLVPPGASRELGISPAGGFPLLYLNDDYDAILSGCVLSHN